MHRSKVSQFLHTSEELWLIGNALSDWSTRIRERVMQFYLTQKYFIVPRSFDSGRMICEDVNLDLHNRTIVSAQYLYSDFMQTT